MNGRLIVFVDMISVTNVTSFYVTIATIYYQHEMISKVTSQKCTALSLCYSKLKSLLQAKKEIQNINVFKKTIVFNVIIKS